jgi:hypothetical protein
VFAIVRTSTISTRAFQAGIRSEISYHSGMVLCVVSGLSRPSGICRISPSDAFSAFSSEIKFFQLPCDVFEGLIDVVDDFEEFQVGRLDDAVLLQGIKINYLVPECAVE